MTTITWTRITTPGNYDPDVACTYAGYYEFGTNGAIMRYVVRIRQMMTGWFEVRVGDDAEWIKEISSLREAQDLVDLILLLRGQHAN